MPGWWYTVESPTTKHLINQFKAAIHAALTTSTETRAMMRARSRLQRFPVAQWIEDLETLQSKSIRVHERVMERQRERLRFLDSGRESPAPSIAPAMTTTSSAQNTAPNSMPNSRATSAAPSRATSPSSEATIPGSQGQMSLGRLLGPSNPAAVPASARRGRSRSNSRTRLGRRSNSSLREAANAPPSSSRSRLGERSDSSLRGTVEAAKNNRVSVVPEGNEDLANLAQMNPPTLPTTHEREDSPRGDNPNSDTPNKGKFPPRFPQLAPVDDTSSPNTPVDTSYPLERSETPLSVHSVTAEQKPFNLQRVNPHFTDSKETYYRAFQFKMESINSKNSEDQLCIEEYLVESEKEWFNRFHQVKMGKSAPRSRSAARSRSGTPASSLRIPWGQASQDVPSPTPGADGPQSPSITGEFLLDNDYKPPTGIRRLLQKKVGDWQLYCFILAFGQIIAANSYQLTLLTGQNGQSGTQLYIIASIYLAASAIWWVLFRLIKQVYLLSLPFVIYGLAFFLVGMGPYASDLAKRGWIYNVATAFYAAASASGSLFFALNFGEEGGSPAQSWAFRACVIQGSQQLYVAALWYWGSTLTASSNAGLPSSVLLTSSPKVTAMTTPVAVFLWAIGAVLFFGLPKYYRQDPGKIPSFYGALFRRKIVIWFFIVVVVQNYWLAAPYGRNWRYLWSSIHAPAWAIVVLLLIFFVGVWALMLAILGGLSKQHSWILPIFAIGLGAPRWTQMLWGISGIGLYVPWGSPAFGAILGRALWLWLGVLDAVQGVGFGIILLQTLTRWHVCFTLLFAQMLGSVATIAARASAPDKTGPGTVFPNFALGVEEGLRRHWFWVGLGFQMVVPVGFFWFFRKAQLFKA